MNRDVQLGLGRIDPGRRYVSLCHLRRPCLVKRTKLFRQPSGSDEGADAITLRGSHKLLWVGSIRSPAACRGVQTAAGHSSRNRRMIADRAITRVGKAKRAHHLRRLREDVGTALRAFAQPTERSRGYTTANFRSITSNTRSSSWPRRRIRPVAEITLYMPCLRASRGSFSMR